MGGDDPVAPPPLGEVVATLKELAYHITGAGATESHRARLYAAALAFLQILHGDGQTLRCVEITWIIRLRCLLSDFVFESILVVIPIAF